MSKRNRITITLSDINWWTKEWVDMLIREISEKNEHDFSYLKKDINSFLRKEGLAITEHKNKLVIK